MGWLVNGESPFQEAAAGPGLLTFEFSLVTCVVFGGVGGGGEKTRKGCSSQREQQVQRSYKMLGSLTCVFNYDCLFD